MSLAMTAKDEMIMARDAEGREIDEKERADDARLTAFLQRMELALVMIDQLRGVLYKPDAPGGNPGEKGQDPQNEGVIP